MLDYDKAMRMARWMKTEAPAITEAIMKVQKAEHGVVALVFSDEGREMNIEILDEPYEPNVKVFPG